MKQIIRNSASRVLMALLGRRNVVRIARALSMEARYDVANKIAENGERMVQEVSLSIARETDASERNFVDAGANVGHWSLSLLELARSAEMEVRVFAFEPSTHTFGRLQRSLEQFARTNLHPVNAALSDKDGTATLHIVGAAAGTNSLHAQPHMHVTETEVIPCTTLDGFAGTHAMSRIVLLKIDTEGHEMSVLRGAERLLARGAIDLVQFEYNHRWISSRHYLRDAFEYLQPFGYSLGKITPHGIEFYADWHHELETWYESNFLACRTPLRQRFPQVQWWNA